MATDWKDAAARYRDPPSATEEETAITREMASLTRFMESDEGVLALDLLEASGRFVRFCESDVDGGRCTVYIMSGDGLGRSDETAGMGAAYVSAGKRKKPHLSMTTAEEVVRAARRYAPRTDAANAIVPWLRIELNKIADAAPKK
jgi:hypothetical protein